MTPYTLDWVWNQTDLKHTEKLVLLLLAYEAATGEALTMPRAQIAQKCNISKRTVDECIRQLVHKGLISVHTHTRDRQRTSCSYILHPDAVTGASS